MPTTFVDVDESWPQHRTITMHPLEEFLPQALGAGTGTFGILETYALVADIRSLQPSTNGHATYTHRMLALKAPL